MILDSVTDILDAASLANYTRLIDRGSGGQISTSLPETYNSEIYYLRRGVDSYNVYNWTTDTLIETIEPIHSLWEVTCTPIVSQYMYVGYYLKSDAKLRIGKVDLVNGTTTVIFTDASAMNSLGGQLSVAFDTTEGKLVFHTGDNSRRVIVTVDTSDDTTNVVLTAGGDPIKTLVSCDSSKIYYNASHTAWYSMDWDGTGNTLIHTMSSSSLGLHTGINGLHTGLYVAPIGWLTLYDSDATNAWLIGAVHGGIFLTNSLPYYLIAWYTNNDIKVLKLATGSSVTVLETISSHAFGEVTARARHMLYKPYESSKYYSQIMLGLAKAFEITFPDREHN